MTHYTDDWEKPKCGADFPPRLSQRDDWVDCPRCLAIINPVPGTSEFTLNRDELLTVECALRIVAATDMQFKMRPHMDALLARIDARTPEVVP